MQNSGVSEVANKHHAAESEVNQEKKCSRKILCLTLKKISDSQSSEILAALKTQFGEKNLRFQK